jgi:aryl-alcohol dehydrogenase-like predicted oxidoreductase
LSTPNINLSLGTAHFGADYGSIIKTSHAEINLEKILYEAWSNNFRFLDTSCNYPNSELSLGGLQELHSKDWKITTKLKINKEYISKKDIYAIYDEGFYGSLKQLKKDKVFSVLIHDFDLINHDYAFNVALEYLRDLKSKGLCEEIGVSVYDPAAIVAHEAINSIDSVQAPYNIFDTRAKALVSNKLDGLKLEVRSIFLQGVLLNSFNKNKNPFFQKWKTIFNNYNQWLVSQELDPVEACIFFASMFNPEKMILGFKAPHEIAEFKRVFNSFIDIKIPEFHAPLDLINPYKW